MKQIVLAILFLVSTDSMANKITTNQASNYVGKNATVCGIIAEITTIRNDTFINIDSPHPYQKFYFYVNNQTLGKQYLYKNVCGTGTVRIHKGKYQINLTDIRSLSFR